MSTAGGADANAEGSGGFDFAEYNQKYKPEGNTWEIGLFMGLFWPALDHNLHVERLPQQPFSRPAFELGIRAAYFPLPFVGAELEAAQMQTSVADNGPSATLSHFRGHIIGQLHTMSITPFILVGGGSLHAASEATGQDADPAFHFGAGVKVPFSRLLSARLDLRDNLTQETGADSGTATHHPELLLGGTLTLGREEPKPPPPPADRDKDNLPDAQDRCPDVPALTPDGCPADTDGDGVVDRDDRCPREAGIAPTGCPDLDVDKDGVSLPCDQCPNEVGVEPDGCPVRDTDGDGIFDDKDQCVKDPETKNGYQDEDGCPDEIPQDVKEFQGVMRGIEFEKGKADIRKNSEKFLKRAAKVMNKYPTIQLEISGHTSSEGEKAFNQKLSEDRAAAVKTWLVENGVEENRITTRGAGPDEPIADNDTKKGREANRRIEFKIVSQ